MTHRVLALVGYALLGVFLAAIAYFDLKEKKIHIWIVAVGMAVIIGAAVMRAAVNGDWSMLTSSAMGALSASTVFAVSKITRGSVGEGDVWVFAMCGIWLGFIGNLVFIWLSFFTAMICGGILVAVGKANRKTKLPLAPFAFAAWVIMGVGVVFGTI